MDHVRLKINYQPDIGMIDIQTSEDDGELDFLYSLIIGMYKEETNELIDGMARPLDGYGLQVNDESKREAIHELCNSISDSLIVFKEKVRETNAD